jgi:pyruvate,water dikinase
MSLFKKFFGKTKEKRLSILKDVQEKFSLFQEILESHNQALRVMSQLEERHQKGRLEGFHSVWEYFVRIQEGVRVTIERMIKLGGDEYLPLRDRFIAIMKDIEGLLPGGRPTLKDDYVIPFSSLDKTRIASVGSKAANLGELKSKLGLPVPDGFAISAWAYEHFIDTNQLHERIKSLLADVRIRGYEDLEVVGDDIRELVEFRSVPADLADAIYAGFDELSTRSKEARFALRSSAVEEDTSFSFAGQYVTFLNVNRDVLLDRYKQILGSKFTPSAISYLLRHSLSEMELGMGVICMEMVDSVASGVVYTKDPVNPSGGYLLVNSIFGLGSYLVEGVLTPDIFHVVRDDGKVIFSQVARKPVKLVMRAEGGVEELSVPEDDQTRPSINEEHLRRLAEFALTLEQHYGEPQDIEWAMNKNGELFLLQTRPLKVLKPKIEICFPDGFTPTILAEGGTPVCFGVGTGPIHHISSIEDIDSVPKGAILVTPNPSPKLVAVMDRINALVTLVGGAASHLATLARELSVPTIAGLSSALDIPQGQEVTVDASDGKIYDGNHPECIPEQEEEGVSSSLGSKLAAEVLNRFIAQITHLSLIHPGEEGFFIENCSTMHDILRYIHQKSMEEMFSTLTKTSHKDHIGLRLKTKIPLLINIIYLDKDFMGNKRWLPEDEIDSLPMKALWGGILQEGWPSRPVPADLKGFLAVVGTDIKGERQPEFSENSYAFLSKEYMLLNLRMGYHFSTIEALVTPAPEKNYIRMQFKLGGAPLERRIRRIWLICELLRRVGFENFSQGDFLDTMVAYQDESEILERLHMLGRITILTKQLDLTLSSDERARWYLSEFLTKLGLNN